MKAWLAAKKILFTFPVPVRVLEILGPADMTFGPVASVRKISLQGATLMRRLPALAPTSAVLSVFLFLKDLEDCS